jgi:hypothetical protein
MQLIKRLIINTLKRIVDKKVSLYSLATCRVENELRTISNRVIL